MPLETVFHHQNRHEVLTGMQVLMPMSGMLIPSLTSSRVIVFQYKFSCSILLVLSLSLLMSLMINAVVGESSFDTSSNYHIDRWCCCASVSLLIFSWEDFGLLESVVHQHAVRDVVLQETSRVSFSAQVIIVIRFLGFFFFCTTFIGSFHVLRERPCHASSLWVTTSTDCTFDSFPSPRDTFVVSISSSAQEDCCQVFQILFLEWVSLWISRNDDYLIRWWRWQRRSLLLWKLSFFELF